MITYVNTVLVSNADGALATKSEVTGFASVDGFKAAVGKIVFMNLDDADINPSSTFDPYAIPNTGIVNKFKIGIITDKYITKSNNGTLLYIPVIKWSNEIKTADIKNIAVLAHPGNDSQEDVVNVNFNQNFPSSLAQRGGFPVVLRLTFKDTPTRYRKWSESYDYYVNPGDNAAAIAAGLADSINGQPRRARVAATAQGGILTLTALPYDDNETADSENVNAKVRFNANVWYSDPLAPGFASNNKYGIGTITKQVGWEYAASAKNIRDRERTAQGYQGIMHRGCWYDPKPTMAVNMNSKYGAIVIEFENMYRAADDIFRKTKQTVEIYSSSASGVATSPTSIASGLVNTIKNWVDYTARTNYVNNSAAVQVPQAPADDDSADDNKD